MISHKPLYNALQLSNLSLTFLKTLSSQAQKFSNLRKKTTYSKELSLKFAP